MSLFFNKNTQTLYFFIFEETGLRLIMVMHFQPDPLYLRKFEIFGEIFSEQEDFRLKKLSHLYRDSNGSKFQELKLIFIGKN